MVMFTNSQLTNVSNLFNKTKINDEFEIMFNNYRSDNKLSIIKFMNILKYIKYRSEIDKIKLNHEVILDIIFDYEPNTFFRVSIKGIKEINEFLNLVHQRSNHVIFSILLTQSEFINNDNYKYIKKIKDPKDIIDLDLYDIRIRKAREEVLSEKEMKTILNIGLSSNSKICFRYKNRLSLELLKNEYETLNIDLTTIQTNSNVNDLILSNKTYELEIDYSLFKEKKEKEEILKRIHLEIINIKKVLEGTDILLNKEESGQIIDVYKKLVYFNDLSNSSNLYSMQPISVEVQHIVDKIPNKYSVTDKADGEKTQLFIYQKNVYLISNNLNIVKTKYTSKYSNTILEGELIYFPELKKNLFMGFDCLFFNNIDQRNEINIKKRISYVTTICKDLNEIYETKEYIDTFNIDNQTQFYLKEIENFYKKLNLELSKINHNDFLFFPKLFLYPTGANSSEVFSFAYNLWNYCTIKKNNINIDCPYTLDGIIFTGIEQKYTRDKREQKYPIYKYKPPSTNSIDVYLLYQRNTETGGYLEVYDNSIGISKNNKIYRIGNLYVGDLVGNKELPVPFLKEENNFEVFFPLEKGEVRDVDGNYVQDATVIELIYNNDPTIQHQYRWTILRTRWDKTESVITQQKKYGNFKDVAIKTWNSIKDAITIDEIKNLANPNSYPKQQKILQSRISSSIISSDRQQDIYYQKITNLARKMRDYHNWIKSIIIYTYCTPFKEYKNSQEHRTSILDIGCGQGGDILKWYHAKVAEYVGIDTDYYGIYSSTNGALSRYNEFKRKFPNFGKVTWIQADGSALLNSKNQTSKIPTMSQENKELIDKTFNKKKFDIFSAQFSIHYLFDTKESIKNLIENIKNHLKLGGFIILTLFDAKQIIEKLGDKDVFTSFYTDDDGNRKKFFEIVKKFDGKYSDKEGQSIDVHISWIMEENKYITEYLVSEKLLTNTMEEAGCRLVESDLFSNLYFLNQPYFTNVIEHEENPKNYKFYKNVAEYYGDLKGVDKESKLWTFLNRYYVFQKIK